MGCVAVFDTMSGNDSYRFAIRQKPSFQNPGWLWEDGHGIRGVFNLGTLHQTHNPRSRSELLSWVGLDAIGETYCFLALWIRESAGAWQAEVSADQNPKAG